MDNYSTLDDVMQELENVSKYMHNSGCGVTLRRHEKMKAQYKNLENELITISNLVESHAPVVRQRVAMQYHLILQDKDVAVEERNNLEMLKDIIETKCPLGISDEDRVQKLCSQMAEMPEEWTIIQITSAVSDIEICNVDVNKFETNPLYLSVFNCGQSEIKPFVIKIPEPRDSVAGNKLELLDDLNEILNINRSSLSSVNGLTRFLNKQKQMDYRFCQQTVDIKLEDLVRSLQNMWLKEWRCLFIGKSENPGIDDAIRSEIEEFLMSECSSAELPQKSRELLFYLTKGTQYLSANELKSGIKLCCENLKEKDRRKVPKFMKDLADRLGLKSQPKNPVILVIDEALDLLPWEMIDVLQNDPVSRVPSFHFVYFLYKAYEKEIKRGYKLVSADIGSYIVNPDSNLEKMEIRMTHFFNYWLPNWTGIRGRLPSSDEFLDLMTKSDIFSYNGHGNGAHIMPIDRLQKAMVKAVVILFGCGSTRITKQGPQIDFFGSYHMYLTARCPCVVGMLWEVTDVSCDYIKSQFLSRWIPSKAPHHWHNVAKRDWTNGLKEVTFELDDICYNNPKTIHFPELQRALCSAKNHSSSYKNKAACVVRGLPIKLMKKKP